MEMGGGVMAKVKSNFSEGLNEYLQTLNRLSGNAEGVAKQALYEGARMVADAVKQNMNALPTDDRWGTQKNKKAGLRPEEKQAVINGFGISGMKENAGVIDVKIGFENAGYTEDGVPVQLLARAANSGTSFMRKSSFFDRAVRSSRAAAKAAMIAKGEEELRKLVK